MKYHADTQKAVGADVFVVNNRTLLCIVDYHSKFPIAKKVSSLSADYMVQTNNLILVEYRLELKIVLGVGINFTSETFNHFCR